MKGLLVIFATVFLAELGDKTQLATILFASDGARSPWGVLAGAAGALVAATGLAVLLGVAAEHYLAAIPLKLVAGLGFIAIGPWSVAGHFHT